MAPHEALRREAKPGARVEHRPLFPDLNAQSLIVLKPAGLHLPLERSEIFPPSMGSFPVVALFLFGSMGSSQEGMVDWGEGRSLDREDDGCSWVEDDLVWEG